MPTTNRDTHLLLSGQLAVATDATLLCAQRGPCIFTQVRDRITTCQKQRNENKNKSGLSKNRSLTTPEGCEVFTSLIQQMRSSRKLLEKRRESWKFRCQQLCLARSLQESTRKLVALLIFARPNTHASLKPANLRESFWKELYSKIMKTTFAGKGINSSRAQFYSHA